MNPISFFICVRLFCLLTVVIHPAIASDVISLDDDVVPVATEEYPSPTDMEAALELKGDVDAEHETTTEVEGDTLISPDPVILKNDLYNALESRLTEIDIEISAAENGDHPPFKPYDFERKAMKPGMYHPDIVRLRDRLIGDMNANSDAVFDRDNSDVPQQVQSHNDSQLYDKTLMSAVKEYQLKHALENDGIIGATTLQMLNRSLQDERTQILINMARLQDPEWHGRPDLRIEVDIARYWLTAYENNNVNFEMPVVVGTKGRQTNRFSTVMTGVRLNPGWTVPKTIKAEDYMPRLRSNPEWFNQHGVMIYTSYDSNAKPIDPTTLDWNYLSDTEIQAMRFYKSASDTNPLGLYRFLMNNEHDIYLHDTNLKRLFKRSGRAYSSGCVRVQDPRKITEFLLKDDAAWTGDKIDTVLAAAATKNVVAKRRIPVYFDYKTAWIDSDGDLILGYDIYGLDKVSEHDIISLSLNNE